MCLGDVSRRLVLGAPIRYRARHAAQRSGTVPFNVANQAIRGPDGNYANFTFCAVVKVHEASHDA